MTMPKLKIKKGDTVIVLTGKNKGAKGEVLSVSPRDNKLVVKGVNIVTQVRKATQANPQSALEKVEAPMHVSNVALADPKSGKPTRVGFETKDGTKVRVARKSGQAISEGAK